MSLRPAAAAPVGAPVCLGDGPSRLHLVLRAGQAAETSGGARSIATFGTKALFALRGDKQAREKFIASQTDAIKKMIVDSGMSISALKTSLTQVLGGLEAMMPDGPRKEKFRRALQKLQRVSTGALPPGCDWDAYVAEKDACKGLTKAQEDLLYNKMSDQRDKENYIFSVFLYLLRVAFMLD